MSNTSQNGTANWYTYNSGYDINRSLRFWLFLVFDAFAVVCTVFVLYHLLTKKELRRALHNHVLIIILLLALIYQVMDIPFHLQYLSEGTVRLATPTMCRIWWFIERSFYTIAMFAPICESTFDHTADLCGADPCYSSIQFFAIVEQIFFGAISSCLIAILSMALLMRVIWQKHRMYQTVRSHKHRKLAVQIIFLSLIYVVFLVRFYIQGDWADSLFPLFFFLAYFLMMLLPYVCLLSLSNFWSTVRKLHPRRGHRVVATLHR